MSLCSYVIKYCLSLLLPVSASRTIARKVASTAHASHGAADAGAGCYVDRLASATDGTTSSEVIEGSATSNFATRTQCVAAAALEGGR